MSKTRNFYTKEFKHKAVELSYAKGSIKQTCKDLDISLSSLVRWRQELKQYGKNSFPGKGNLTGGSSCATATTAGIAALIWSKYPNWSRTQVLNRLKQSSDLYPNKSNSFGYGNIDALQAVQ